MWSDLQVINRLVWKYIDYLFNWILINPSNEYLKNHDKLIFLLPYVLIFYFVTGS